MLDQNFVEYCSSSSIFGLDISRFFEFDDLGGGLNSYTTPAFATGAFW